MATRSEIIIHKRNGKWQSIYCHYDGGLHQNGEILLNYYRSQDKVDKLAALGNLSSLGKSIGRKHAFDAPQRYADDDSTEISAAFKVWKSTIEKMCTAYIRDRGLGPWHPEKDQATFEEAESGLVTDTLQEQLNDLNPWSEYTYIWADSETTETPITPCWWVMKTGKKHKSPIHLGDALDEKIDVHTARLPSWSHEKKEGAETALLVATGGLKTPEQLSLPFDPPLITVVG